jgi:hypothetical protein
MHYEVVHVSAAVEYGHLDILNWLVKALGCWVLAFVQGSTSSCCYFAYCGYPGSYSFRRMFFSHNHVHFRREFRLSLIRHAVLGEDSFRFAAMIGKLS